MDPENLDRVGEAPPASSSRELASAWVPLPPEEASDPNAVKVAVAGDGRALYFSRAPIPYPRGAAAAYRKHLGLYAYRAATLEKIAALPPSDLERSESLEQLRWLEAGYSIW